MTDQLISPEGAVLAKEALRRIDEDPYSFGQSTWGYKTDCGTVACMAGHVILAAGGELHPTLQGHYRYEGRLEHAADLARELLGIDPFHADTLFAATNDREDLEMIVKELIEGLRNELAGRTPLYGVGEYHEDYDEVPFDVDDDPVTVGPWYDEDNRF